MWIQLIILIILIALNAVFALTEMAFISLNDIKIKNKAKEGDKKAIQIMKMLEIPSKFLATIQIGITIAGFLSSAFASDAFSTNISKMLYNMLPTVSISTWETISMIVVTIILSFFTLVFGELVPKRIAMKYHEQIAYKVVGFIKFVSVITAPFVKLLTISTTVITKIFGVNEEEEQLVTEEEIKMMIEQGEEKGVIRKYEKDMINNVFEFNDTIVSNIMIPKENIIGLELTSTNKDLMKKLYEIKCKHSRIPIYKDNINNIVGILYIKDIFKDQNSINLSIKEIMKNPYYISPNKKINEIFKELQQSKIQIAIVVDDKKNTLGIITMENIIEELVGELEE